VPEVVGLGPIYSLEGITPKVAPDAFIAPGAVVIGDVEIGAETGIWFHCMVRGDLNIIRIGARTNIQDGTIIHVTHDGPYGKPGGLATIIGADVTIGHAAIVHACVIEDACLIGMGSTILDGAVVKKHGFVGAGALISPGKIVGSGELWLGNPARCVRKLGEKEIEQLYYSAQHYVRLKDRYLADAFPAGRPAPDATAGFRPE